MARTLTPAPASAPKTSAAMPGVPAMPSPTTLRMLWPVSGVHVLDLAVAELRRQTRAAPSAAVRSASFSGTAKQIECSELPCEIRMTEIAVLAQRAEQALRGAGHADHPGALDVDERHGVDAGDALHGVRPTSGAAQMSVPGFSGANVLRIQIGMPFVTAGAIVCGWITLAPK